MKKKLYYYFYVFITGSILGYFIELIYSYIRRGDIINHTSVVIGPFNMTIGVCAVVLTGILYKFKDKSIWKLFLLSFIGGTILEYIISFLMEKAFGFVAWNYSRYFLNINGRVCLLYSVQWGIIGIFWIKVFYPLFIKLINKIKPKIGYFIMGFSISFLILDGLLTISAINRAHNLEKGIPPENKYEEFLDKTFSVDYLNNMFNHYWK